MKTKPPSARPMRSEVARAVATLRSDPGLIGMKLRQRWQQRKQQAAPAPGAPPRPKDRLDRSDPGRRGRTASGSQGSHWHRLRRRGVPRRARAARRRTSRWTWVSHRDSDVLAGAALPGTTSGPRTDAVVVGGADVKTAYLNALRWMERSGEVRPVFWVGQSFEYCGSTLPIPGGGGGRRHLPVPPLRRLLPDQGSAPRAGDEPATRAAITSGT